jgi:hypothetical protein
MEDPELVTLISEDEPEPPPPSPPELGRKLVIQLITVVILKVATGIAIKNLAKTIRDFDVIYPEHLDKIKWKDQS